MIEIRIADKPFIYKNKNYKDFYNYFILLDSEKIEGILEFDLFKVSLVNIDCINIEENYDGLIRTALNYFFVHGYKKCALDKVNFNKFIGNYLSANVFTDNIINMELFFNIKCNS